MAEEIYVNAPGKAVDPVPGSAGLNTQLPGQATTVDGVGGGVGEGLDHLSQVAIDEGIVRFKGNITPLMTLMMKSKKVTVDSSEVAHYMIDEARTKVAVSEQVEENTGKQQFPLPMTAADAALCLPCKTLLCRGVNGYLPDGKTETPGLPLMLYIIGRNDDTGYPIVRALNAFKHPEGPAHKALRQALGKARFDFIASLRFSGKLILGEDAYGSTGEHYFWPKQYSSARNAQKRMDKLSEAGIPSLRFSGKLILGEDAYGSTGEHYFWPKQYSSARNAQKRMDKLSEAGIRCRLTGYNGGYIEFLGYTPETENLLEQEREEYSRAYRAWASEQSIPQRMKAIKYMNHSNQIQLQQS